VTVQALSAQQPRVEDFLAVRGADRMSHPGGTLLDHLRRVAALLAPWGAEPELQLAGLCHAAYGTDGFDGSLLAITERGALAELIGDRAEALVYLYASCDRALVHPRLGAGFPVVFRDRFTGRDHTPVKADVQAMMEITAANELDVLTHNAELAERHGPSLYRLFSRSRQLLSSGAWHACAAHLAQFAPEPGIAISGLDHLVLTVADIEQTIAFYQRAFGMRPLTFGEGRRALAFGSSKINLHQAGRELLPHAIRPTPGSADLCLVTETPQDQVLAHLASCGVPVVEGPVPRTGALGPILSTYVRDPDGNLIEISTYTSDPPERRHREPRIQSSPAPGNKTVPGPRVRL
jgi:catechol 2,3-dioxygenase-like lactoylglutathione lyase family enzyme